MEAKFSKRVKEVISLSREEALRYGHDHIGTEHLLLSMIWEGKGSAISLLKNLGVSVNELKHALEDATRSAYTQRQNTNGSIPLTTQAEQVIKTTYLEAKFDDSKVIGTVHLLLAILRDRDDPTSKILSKYNVTYDAVRDFAS
ncbi:ATP-dependent Clp protease ATP-binding subunit [Pontibacter russatus]|uniref:ATP-dependent Clp protease ATP-binding subunit n=1 Tax=Pontibacter russatus TaxID=2694929 RepID=UPI0013796A4A|nr:ATP-dependent Clp protease ATP-binding subunit [Pontibacter russatus]